LPKPVKVKAMTLHQMMQAALAATPSKDDDVGKQLGRDDEDVAAGQRRSGQCMLLQVVHV
jgi:hypothetical protein